MDEYQEIQPQKPVSKRAEVGKVNLHKTKAKKARYVFLENTARRDNWLVNVIKFKCQLSLINTVFHAELCH